MAIGQQLIAPNGLGALEKDRRYYLVRNSAESGLVSLISFWRDKREWRVRLDRLPCDAFEVALLESKQLVPVIQPHRMPTWLSEIEGETFDAVDEQRNESSTSYRRQIDERFAHIEPLLERLDEILEMADPLREVATFARKRSTPQHPYRIQLWLFTYICHGRNIWSLKAPTHRNGRWDRKAPDHVGKKLGRPSLAKGKNFGHPSAPIADRIVKSYLKLCALKSSMLQIYRKSLAEEFGCKVELHGNVFVVTHPEGKIFPTYGQFRYRVVKEFGIEAVQRTLYGNARVRKKLPNEGSFSEACANLLEALEVDAFYSQERPRAMFSDEPMDALAVARPVDVATGEICGIGFALGKENAESYSTMLFSMAVPKSRFCALFGLSISDDEWPATGMSGSYISDRGPGAKRDLLERLQEKYPMREIAPSWSGQSKASVESSHPREVAVDGAPTYFLSDLNVIEMVRREILRAVRDNHTSDASSRLTPTMLSEFAHQQIPPTPHNIWKYLDSRMRTSAVSMDFAAAVRAFLPPTKFKLSRDGVFLRHRQFDSPRLRELGLLKKVASGQSIELDGYTLPMCVRHAWIEVNGELVEIDAKLRIRDDQGQLYVPLSQLDQQADSLASLRSLQRQHATAADLHYSAKFKESTGKDWNAGERRQGSPSKRVGNTNSEFERKVVTGKNGRERGAA